VKVDCGCLMAIDQLIHGGGLEIEHPSSKGSCSHLFGLIIIWLLVFSRALTYFAHMLRHSTLCYIILLLDNGAVLSLSLLELVRWLVHFAHD
jgi:hypothetical protein